MSSAEPGARLQQLADDLRARWLAGQPKPVESYLSEHRDLLGDPGSLVELIVQEFRLRQQLGESPQPAEYTQRFPALAAALTTVLAPQSSDTVHANRPGADSAVTDYDVTQMWTAGEPPSHLPGASVGFPSHPTVANPTASASAPSGVPRGPAIKRIGDYELLHEIARGGMGVVYKARQIKLNRIVALKMILAGQLASDELVRRFYSEAEAAANLDHPGIVPIYEVNHHEGQHYFSMGYVDGSSLAARVREGPLAPRVAADLVRRIAEAVHYAHQHGVIHRDLKPQNVLLTADGQPKVTDFGLAKTVQSDSNMTASGQVLGTPSYMPPEQAAGKVDELGPAADVYALGAVLYCLLTARPPFQAASVVETLKQVLEREPLSPRQLNPAVDRDLETICLKCLQKDARHRLPSAQELADELRRFLDGEPIRSRRIGPLRRAARWCRRKPLAAALCASVLVLAVVAGGAVMVAKQSARTGELTQLTSRFEAGIDQPQLTAEYLGEMDATIAAVALLRPEQEPQLRRRLTNRFAGLIETALAAPKLDSAEIERLEQALPLLAPRDAAREQSLRAALAQRRSDWQPLFVLQPPYVELADVFDPLHVRAAQGHLESIAPQSPVLPVPPAQPGRPAQPLVRPVVTKVKGGEHVRFEAAFAPDWQSADDLGLRLVDDRGAGYEFHLRIVLPRRQDDDDAETPSPRSFAAVRADNGAFLLEIRRNGDPIQRRRLSAADVVPGRLRFWAERSRDRLSVQINDLPPLAFVDPFRVRTASSTLALQWPAGVSLEELRASRQVQPVAASSLEQADQEYDVEKFAEALRLYQEPAINAPDSPYRQEARFKQGLCLLALKRLDEAAAVLEPLLIESGERWPPLAGCQLWLLRLRQKQEADADAIFVNLSTRFRFEELAALIPSELRDEILNSYGAQFQTAKSIYRYNPKQVANLQRAVEVDRFLSLDGRGDNDRMLLLANAYEFAGDLAAAVEITTQLARTDRRELVLRRHARLLRQVGQPEAAIAEMDRALTVDYQDSPRDWLSLLVERSRAKMELGRTQSAEADVDAVLQLESQLIAAKQPLSHPPLSSSYLMKGFFHRDRGDEGNALDVWRQGYGKLRARVKEYGVVSELTVNVLIFGSLTGELTDADATEFMQAVSRGGDSTFLAAIRSVITPQQSAGTLRTMWLSPRGQTLARQTAFQTISRGDRVRTPLILAGAAFLRLGAFESATSPEQDELLWNAVSAGYDLAFLTGKLGPAHVVQLGLSWKGTTGLLGWGGLAPVLPQPTRAEVTYILAHRYLRQNNRPQAESFFNTVLKDAEPGSPLAALVARDLELLKAGQGRLIVESRAPEGVQVVVSKAGQPVATLDVQGRGEAALPPGTYDVALADMSDELGLSKAKVTVALCTSPAVNVDWLWHDGPAAALPGLVARPADLPGLGRWQVETLGQRGNGKFEWSLSPDGKWIADVGSDGHIRLLDAQTLQLTRLFAGHAVSPGSIAWSADSMWLASGGGDDTLRFWNVADGVPSAVAHVPSVRGVAWSPLGDRVAASAWNNRVAIIARDGRQLASIDHKTGVNDLAFSRDGQWLATLGGDASIRRWDAQGQPIATWSDQKGKFVCLTCSDDGRWLATGSEDKTVRLWDAATGQVTHVLTDFKVGITAVAFSHDSRTLAVGLSNGQLVGFTTLEGSRAWSLDTTDRPVAKIVWAADDQRFFVGGDNYRIRVLQPGATPGPALVHSLPRDFTAGLAISPDGRRTAVGYDQAMLMLDEHGLPLPLETTHTWGFKAAAFSPDGMRVASLGRDSRLRLWAADTGNVEATLMEHTGSVPVQGIAWSPDGMQVAVGGAGKTLRTWRADGTLVLNLNNLPDAPQCVAWSPDGHWVAAGLGDSDKKIRLYDSSTGEPGPVLSGHTAAVRHVAWSPTGERLASVSNDIKVRLWEADGRPGPVMTGHRYHIVAVAWSPDGTRLASASSDSTCRLWNADGSAGPVITGHARGLRNLFWSTDGAELATAGDDSIVRYWDGKTGRLLRTLVLLPQGQTATFGSSGRLLHATPEAEQHLVYLLEQSTQSLDILTPAAFRARLAKP